MAGFSETSIDKKEYLLADIRKFILKTEEEFKFWIETQRELHDKGNISMSTAMNIPIDGLAKMLDELKFIYGRNGGRFNE